MNDDEQAPPVHVQDFELQTGMRDPMTDPNTAFIRLTVHAWSAEQDYQYHPELWLTPEQARRLAEHLLRAAGSSSTPPSPPRPPVQ